MSLLGTCKCPSYMFTNFYEHKPFAVIEFDEDGDEKVTGLFPDLLSRIVDAVCMDCKAYRKPSLYYNKTKNGRPALKMNLDKVVNGIDEFTHFTFPIFGKFDLKTFSGVFPYIGIVQSQGSAMIVYQPKVVAVGFWRIFTAVANAWSVVLVAVIITYLTGCVLWFAVSF